MHKVAIYSLVRGTCMGRSLLTICNFCPGRQCACAAGLAVPRRHSGIHVAKKAFDIARVGFGLAAVPGSGTTS